MELTALNYEIIERTYKIKNIRSKWRPSRLSESTPIIFSIELTHLDSMVSIYIIRKKASTFALYSFTNILKIKIQKFGILKDLG